MQKKKISNQLALFLLLINFDWVVKNINFYEFS